MYKYIRAYSYGYDEGIKTAKKDFKRKKYNHYKNKKYKECISLLYDIGYIEGYMKTIYCLKNNLSLYKKI